MKNKKINFYYTFLTVFLLFSTIYLSVIVLYNISKLISYRQKLTKLETTHNEAIKIQNRLNAEIESFKSPEIYEAFLRNHLKYAAKYDILIIIVPEK